MRLTAFAIVLGLSAAPLAAQEAVPLDSSFTGRCGAETTDDKWQLSRTVDKFDNFSRAVSKVADWNAQNESGHNIKTAAQQFIQKADTSYQLYVVYRSRDWMFIEEGESLVLLADGVRVGLTTPQVSHEVEPAMGGVLEIATYPVTLATLRQLAEAKELEGKLRGKQRTLMLTPKMPEVACSFARLVRDARR